MQNNLISNLTQLLVFLLISFNAYSGSDNNNLNSQESLDVVLTREYSPCSIQDEIHDSEIHNLTTAIILSGDAAFEEGDELIGSSNAKAIVDSYDLLSNKLTYYQTVFTGFKSFSLEEKVFGKNSKVSRIKEFILENNVPCSDLIVSIEEIPEQMIFIFSYSEEAIRAQLAAQEMMAEIKEEMARQAALEAKLAAQEMMAEIKEEMARQAALEAFQQKLAAEKAAAAASTAAYQERLLEEELAAFEAQLAAELAADAMMAAIEAELKAFEAQLAAQLAAQEMMAEIKEEMARQAALEAFQQKLADERAAAAASTAEYLAKVAYDSRVAKIMSDLIEQLDEIGITNEYKSIIADDLLKEAVDKLKEEKFIGTISGEIVTVAIHDFCKVNLGLSDSNIELFRKALEGDYLGNVGPQVKNGTEFTLNRWNKYIECVGSKRE